MDDLEIIQLIRELQTQIADLIKIDKIQQEEIMLLKDAVLKLVNKE